MSDREGNGFMWFVAGLGLGALVGVLYAPRSGRETREQILRSADEGREWAGTRAREAREQANQWVERGKDVVRAQKDQIGSAIDAGRQAYRSATTEKP
jgi:gas vesicle protein